MNVIENFVELSEQELKEFADKLVKTINSESLLSDETNFKLADLEVDELSGNLSIFVETEEAVEVSRECTWMCYDEDDIHSKPSESDVDFDDRLDNDVLNALKSNEFEVEGYKISVDYEDGETSDCVDFEVTDYEEGEGGIGDYEFWGFRGHDSYPEYEVHGILVCAHDFALRLTVEPITGYREVTEEVEEENFTYYIWALGKDSDDDPIDHERFLGSRPTYEEAVKKAQSVRSINQVFSDEELEGFDKDDYVVIVVETLKCKPGSRLPEDPTKPVKEDEIKKIYMK